MIPFALLFSSLLFFTCGFSSVTILLASLSLREVLDLTWREGAWIQGAYFLGYLVFAPLGGVWFQRIYPKEALQYALVLAVLGTLGALLGAAENSFVTIVFSIFWMGSGMAMVHVSLSTYVYKMGEPSRAAARLTFMQAVMSLGQIGAPLVGSWTMLGKISSAAGPLVIKTPFLLIFLLFSFLFVISFWIPKGQKTSKEDSEEHPFPYGFALLGMLAMSAAIGAEVSESSYLVPLFSHLTNHSLEHAGYFSTLYWVLFLVGRLGGSVLLERVRPESLLFFHASLGVGLSMAITIVGGITAAVSATLLGLAASVLFPLVFALTLSRAIGHRQEVSGLLCMTNAGGAFFPWVMGQVADEVGLGVSYLVVTFLYAFLLFFSTVYLRAKKVEV